MRFGFRNLLQAFASARRSRTIHVLRLAIIISPAASISGFAHADPIPLPPDAAAIIGREKMSPIPAEGGWYVQTWLSPDIITGSALPARYSGRAHPAGTAIEVIETTRGFSALHKLPTDEIWHFYGGMPLEFLLLFPDGSIKRPLLDSAHPTLTAPGGVWQGSRPQGDGPAWSFAGTTMAPGFIPDDFEIGSRRHLERLYPAARNEINRLTRTDR
ncbi:cupin domain-containing protein [Acetobacter sacchari]|nr:cupin domain-containing protein [Acetobacter sacchari]